MANSQNHSVNENSEENQDRVSTSNFGFFNAKDIHLDGLDTMNDNVGKLKLSEFKNKIESHIANSMYPQIVSNPRSIARKNK
jgi:hypothetical protein